MLNQDPVAMYRTATDRAVAVVEAVEPDQLSAPTPCTEWTVQQIIDHLVAGTEFLLAAIARRQPVTPTSVTGADFRCGIERVLTALDRPGVLEQTCLSPLGDEWSVALMVAGTSLDVLMHTWDLARATGQDERLDPGVVQACAAAFLPEIPERGRAAGFIGPAVAVGDQASPQDRLLAAMGRRPQPMAAPERRP